MRLFRHLAAVLGAVSLVGACGGGASPTVPESASYGRPTASAEQPGGGPSTTAAAAPPAAPATTAPPAAKKPTATAPAPSPARRDDTKPTLEQDPNPGQPYPEHRFPPTWKLIADGQAGGFEWRLYGQPKDDGACYGLAVEGGGSGGCKQGAFAVSGSNSPGQPHFLYGMVPLSTDRVVAEYSGAPPDTFPVLRKDGYKVRFFVGTRGPAPILRVVAYDKAGKVVGEKKDMAHYNG